MEFNPNLKRGFSPNEKEKLKDIGLSLSFLNSRYSRARARAKNRDGKILPRYQFYRKLANLTIIKAQELNLTPFKTLKVCDIHSTNLKDYILFELLTKKEHLELHKKLKREAAEKILRENVFKCKKCNKIKRLSEFYPEKRSLIGIEKTCKKCRLIQNKIRKNFNAEKVVA